jgi:adenosine kinase
MKIAVAGSIATDHLMTFPGRFAEQFIADQLHQVSLSFLVDELVVRRGGVAANIAYGMGQLGLRPALVGSVGTDFADYRSWLERHGVDCESVRISEIAHTARFVCTTDLDSCQIASFYSGAMAETRMIELRPVAERLGGLDMVLVGASDPEAMVRQSQECRERGYPFAADPSQQLARMDGGEVFGLIEGAEFLLTNEYERSLLQSKAGLTDAQLLELVGVRVTTLGRDGVEIVARGEAPIRVPAAREIEPVDPTGGGDAFRAGFFAAISWGLGLERAGQVGALVAMLALERVGAQEYAVRHDEFATRMGEAYGAAAAEEVRPHLGRPVVSGDSRQPDRAHL